ncbi:MAG: helix-hairpin-helix domain-containing protein [Rikenellaceae bacterium]|nr:helix-hairpin-helix domain-containing protein [Rikenellaceae bacterium]
MKQLKEIFDALFKFTKDERLAIAVLAAGVVCIAVIRLVANRPIGSRVEVGIAAPVQATVKRADTLFQFDPNSVSISELQLLGFSSKQAQAIDNYRRAGAKFKTPADFGRSFVVSDSMLRRLTPYMVFAPQIDSVKTETIKQKNTIKKSDLNRADSTSLCAIYGIGKTLSHRILEYRQRLGGFVNFDQLYEIYGLNNYAIDEIKKKFFIDSAEIQKIDINFASGKILSKHPYMDYHTVGRVLKFREMKGGWNNIAEMKKDEILLPDEARKLEPYLVFRHENCDSNRK